MGNLRIAVYAICRNEAQFVRRWMDSMGEADEITVLDTGSTDDTPALLRELGARVTEEAVEPWRFDTARNRSLALVDPKADLCVCTDLDEVFLPGWREELERTWRPGVDQIRYRYIWNTTPEGGDGISFWADKIHTRQGFHWVYPVHEVLRKDQGTPRRRDAPGIRLEHHADNSKSRAGYLPLLELAVRENPEDDRCIHYLGREYMYRGRWREAADTLTRYLALPSARWEEERCAAMRYLARCTRNLGQLDQAERWLMRACGEAPGLREPWMDLARFCLDREDWMGAAAAARRALTIRTPSTRYLSEPEAWGPAPYDLLAVALFYAGDPLHALAMGEEALKRAPMDPRLRDNLRRIRGHLRSGWDRALPVRPLENETKF